MSTKQPPHPARSEVVLSEAEEAFVTNVGRGMPVYLAAVHAGYSPSNGRYLVRRRHIAFALHEMLHNLADIIRSYLPAGDRR